MVVKGNQSGFTFIEVLLTTTIFGIITPVIIMIFSQSIANYRKSSTLMVIQDTANQVMTMVDGRIRNSGRIIAFSGIGSCAGECKSSWLFLEHSTGDMNCLYIGYHAGGSVNSPDTWVKNGYVFVQTFNDEECSSIDPETGFADNPTPLTEKGGDLSILSSPSDDHSIYGVNVAKLEFTINHRLGNDPATIKTVGEFHQGVRGDGSDPPANEKISHILSTVTSIR